MNLNAQKVLHFNFKLKHLNFSWTYVTQFVSTDLELDNDLFWILILKYLNWTPVSGPNSMWKYNYVSNYKVRLNKRAETFFQPAETAEEREACSE